MLGDTQRRQGQGRRAAVQQQPPQQPGEGHLQDGMDGTPLISPLPGMFQRWSEEGP